MTDILCTFLIIAFIALIFLFKSPHVDKTAKKTALLFPVVVLAITFFDVFFNDRDIVFTCNKTEMTCTYFHSTIADKTLRFVRSYDISGPLNLELREKVKRSRHSSRRRYEIYFHTEKGDFALPKEFLFRSDAEEELQKIDEFLYMETPVYLYRETKNADDDKMAVILPLLVTAYVMVVFLIKRRRRKDDETDLR